MVSKLTDSILTLEAGQAIALEHGYHYTTVRCIEDQLWLTQEGLAGDIVLSAGEKIALRGHGRIVIEAASKAKLAVSLTPVVAAHPLVQAATHWLHKLGHSLDGLRHAPAGAHTKA